MSYFVSTYGGDLATNRSGLGAVQRALQHMNIGQLTGMARSQGVNFGPAAESYIQQMLIRDQQDRYNKQIQGLQSNFQQQMSQQAAQYNQAQRRQEQEVAKMQQQALEAQTRQAAPEQSAQILGVGKNLTIRPGARTRFSRPELQIKSVNI